MAHLRKTVKVVDRRYRMDGRMYQWWADQHEEEPSRPFYVAPRSKQRQCQNPNCGHKPLFNIWVMRHESSGEVKEIGTHCHQRWKRLRGYATDAWFNEYEANLITMGKTQRGRRFTSAEMKKIRKESRQSWIIKQVKKGNIPPLERMPMPYQNFQTREQADEWAENHGGYVSGDTWRNEKVGIDHRISKYQTDTRDTVRKHFWIIYVNPKYKGEY